MSLIGNLCKKSLVDYTFPVELYLYDVKAFTWGMNNCMLRQCIINFIWQPDQSCTMSDDNMQTNTWAYEWSLHTLDSNGSTGDDCCTQNSDEKGIFGCISNHYNLHRKHAYDLKGKWKPPPSLMITSKFYSNIKDKTICS